ncbi:MAG TPA: serine/threonine-protein kinase [Planctomycetaceae bacterium]|nr:serine/threonine-protein kinase [Planctomycetaceae bacterium]
MNQDPTKSASAEAILAQFVADLERASDIAKVVGDYAREHPQLADELNEMARLIGALDERRWQAQETAPARLGEFRIVREIPGGGMGRVYEAIQEPLGRRVAVKTIRGDRLSPQVRARFLREQTVLASLHQTHIVPIHTAGQSGELQYFVMPYIEGVTLHQIVETVKLEHSQSPGARTPTVAKLASRRLDSTVLGGGNGTTAPPADRHAATSTPPLQRIRLSMDYFRSIAKVILDAAEAFHHVHGLQILHRDLKPSNLMVDTAGQCWIIDFGLAAYQHDGAHSSSAPDAAGSDVSHLYRRLTIAEGQGPGTPPYMAPEQWRKEHVDARTDVWGLGVTLYEMLTLRQAFAGKSHDEIRRKVESEDPTAPRRVVSDMPRDLEAVCLKALKKDPAARYQTAKELAADLQRWLNHEPVTARRTHVVRRVLLWARRNRGWATAIGTFFLACVGAAAFAEVREREQRRESLLQQMQNVRLMPHRICQTAGIFNWVDDGWDLVRQAANIRRDEVLRDQAAAFLSGIGGHAIKIVNDFDASAIAFDAGGRRVLIGGSAKAEARIWDSETDETQQSKLTGSGPVTFSADGAARQLVATGENRFPLLWRDVSKDSILSELRPLNEPPAGAANEFLVTAQTITPEGTFAAACATATTGADLCIVWETGSGAVVRQIQHGGPHVTAVAVSPDGGFLAAGDAEGHVSIWPLPQGDPFVLPSASSSQLRCLAFGPHVHGPVSKDRADKWLLAGGDAGGTVTIWDLGRKAALAFCRGSVYDVYALAFSPDGVTLASTGRGHTRLWDIATGRLLLQVHGGDWMTGVAFSSDGRRLAVSLALSEWPSPSPKPAAIVWELEPHRGVQTLRGLTSQIAPAKVCFTRDGSRVAAVSLDWRVAIWDLPSGVLRYRFEVPSGLTADNTSLAFSPDGQQFALSAGRHAKLWDLKSGKETTWQLPDGLVDSLVFDATGTRLFLARMETADWNRSPDSSSSYRQFPRVLRVRDLLAMPDHDLRRPGKSNPTWEMGLFNRRTIKTAATPDGRFLVATGTHEAAPDKQETLLKVFETASGKEVLSIGATDNFIIDLSGNLLAFWPNFGPNPRPTTLVQIPSGKWVGTGLPHGSLLAPEARLTAVNRGGRDGFHLYRRGEERALVRLGIDAEDQAFALSSDATRVAASGSGEGMVNVYYLPEIQRRLAALGFGW